MFGCFSGFELSNLETRAWGANKLLVVRGMGLQVWGYRFEASGLGLGKEERLQGLWFIIRTYRLQYIR